MQAAERPPYGTHVQRIDVHLGVRSYPIFIGAGVMEQRRRTFPGDSCARRPARDEHDRGPAVRQPGSPRRSRRDAASRWRCRTARCTRRSRTSRACSTCWSPIDSAAMPAWWRSAAAWSATWPDSPLPAISAASPSCRCRPPCWRRWTRRWAARPASIIRAARTSLAPFTSPRPYSPIPAPSTRCRIANCAPDWPRSSSTA